MRGGFDHCETLLREADKDRFVATLFAPAAARPALHALYAFNLEIARVREAIRDPMAGEIRLQWWRDALSGQRPGETEAHPVAAVLLPTMARYHLPLERLTALIEARRFDLCGEPMATFANLAGYADGTSTNLILLAGQVLAEGHDPEISALAHHAGLAHALAGVLKAFPIHAARGQLFVPIEILERHHADYRTVLRSPATPELRAALAEARLIARRHLAKARAAISTAPAAVLPALLPVALVGSTLARMERRDFDPFVPVEIPVWRRQWLIWRAAKRPQRIFE
jgi:15-cis-phytoene synthase